MDRTRIKEFYAHGLESDRLETEVFKLEGIRTKEIIERYLHSNNLEILDIGGGAGYYSFWLQEKGHNVTLLDLSSENIELSKMRSETTGISLKNYITGDATELQFLDEQFDMILLFGPLYHLTERVERIRALTEAKRVLKPGGFLLAAVISRYASLIDGFQRDLVLDDCFFSLLIDDLKTGIHLNKTDNLEYFTTAYFHTIEEVIDEVKESGFEFQKLVPVESFGWIAGDLSKKSNSASYTQKLLGVIEMVEQDKELLAISPHIIAVARKT